MTIMELDGVLSIIRPGAQRIIRAKPGATVVDITDIQWLDVVQTMPSQAEIDAGFVQLNDATFQLNRLRAQAVALVSDPAADNKFVRSVLLVILDEVNTIRTALSLPTRTVNQMKTAIQAKLNSGAAD